MTPPPIYRDGSMLQFIVVSRSIRITRIYWVHEVQRILKFTSQFVSASE